ncbi:MAG: hypothetical protein LBD71_05705 [Treponema sp.]|jgi:hypothetical protein|nr:hypothetical protein [Treponema sp.]
MFFPPDLPDKFRNLPKAAGGFFEKNRIAAVVCLLAVLLILGFVMLLAMNNNSEREAVPRAPLIPPEELFLGEEPDFIPPVILEREPRRAWTGEDAAPFWRDPLKRGEEPWRERIESAVDELLEGVP